jgi:hypothetical protein
MPDDNKSDDNKDQPKPLTEEDVGRIVNAAVTSHLKRTLATGLPEAIKESLAAMNFGQQIEETVKKLVPQPADSAAKSKDKPGDDEFKRQLQALGEKLEASERARAEAEKQRAEIEHQRMFDGALGKFRSAITKDVRPELLDVAVDHFSKRLTLDEQGTPLLRVRRAPYKGAPEEDASVPLDEAVPLFLASKELHPFKPAPGGQQADGNQSPKKQVSYVSSDADADDSAKVNAALKAFELAGIDPGSFG